MLHEKWWVNHDLTVLSYIWVDGGYILAPVLTEHKNGLKMVEIGGCE